MTKQIEDALNSRPFQKKGVEFCIKNKKAIIADQPGLGKTIQAIAAVQQAGITGTILVIAPKTAAYVTWPAIAIFNYLLKRKMIICTCMKSHI